MQRRWFNLAAAVWAALLALCTVTVLAKLLADDFPFKGWAHYYRTTLVDRKKLGYNTLPPYRGDGYFDPFAGDQHRGDYFGYAYWDVPYWPRGDPGLGSANPLPPLVERHEVFAVAPSVLFSTLGVGWAAWIAIPVWRILRRPPQRCGLQELCPICGYDVRASPNRCPECGTKFL